MSEYDTADMKNLHYHAFNYRNAHSTQAGKEFDTLEEFVSRMCIAASDRWREEWSEVYNENQILSNTCDESLAYIKELQVEVATLRDYGRAEYLRAIEDAARIAATRWDVLKETEAAHYRLSNMPFNVGNFGMNFTLAEESRDIAYAIRALAGEKT